ncbi:MAG TPA: succinate dehydrogenase assembly factor 2 [Thiotrichales bacterium]|nr:succinate dehydrogenase assembly factor 2 [Thiotrichales bacterium]
MAADRGEERRRIAWRCRRGMLELDLLLQGFLRRGYDDLTAEERESFLTLLEFPDNPLLEVLMGRQEAVEPEIARVVRKIRAAAAA